MEIRNKAALVLFALGVMISGSVVNAAGEAKSPTGTSSEPSTGLEGAVRASAPVLPSKIEGVEEAATTATEGAVDTADSSAATTATEGAGEEAATEGAVDTADSSAEDTGTEGAGEEAGTADSSAAAAAASTWQAKTWASLVEKYELVKNNPNAADTVTVAATAALLGAFFANAAWQYSNLVVVKGQEKPTFGAFLRTQLSAPVKLNLNTVLRFVVPAVALSGIGYALWKHSKSVAA